MTFSAASSTFLTSSSRLNTVMATEQQMSAEWNPGWMAFSVATTPPTGMIPAGMASGMTTPALTVGTRIS